MHTITPHNTFINIVTSNHKNTNHSNILWQIVVSFYCPFSRKRLRLFRTRNKVNSDDEITNTLPAASGHLHCFRLISRFTLYCCVRWVACQLAKADESARLFVLAHFTVGVRTRGLQDTRG